jgi:hypothetical protein
MEKQQNVASHGNFFGTVEHGSTVPMFILFFLFFFEKSMEKV